MLSPAELAAARNDNAPRGHRAMKDTFGRIIGVWTGPIEGPQMSRSAARAAVEGARLSWARYVADEGDYPTYPSAIVLGWIRASVY